LTALQDRHSNSRRHLRWLRLLLAAVLLTPIISVPAAVTAPPAQASDLSDAVARQQALDKLIAQQKKQLATIGAQQASLKSEMALTSQNIDQLNENVDQLQLQIDLMQGQVNDVHAQYDALVATENQLQVQFDGLQAQADAKQAQLVQRQKALAARIVAAYKTNQTPLLAQLLTSSSLTDVLSDVSYYLDLGEQDKALAQQIQDDQRTLAQMLAQVKDARKSVDDLAAQVSIQRELLDGEMLQLTSAADQLEATKKSLDAQFAKQQAADAKLAKNKAALAAAIKSNGEASQKLADTIQKLAAAEGNKGRIPSQYSGSLQWPMGGKVSQEYGCTGWFSEPRVGSCAHFHQGIDLVAPCLTPVHAAGAGVVVFVGYNPYDPPPRAWLVIIAHSTHLVTWYAHMTGKAISGVYVGAQVRAGQVIGTENTTGHSTGCHLHWAVLVDGVFKNPRLFI
jgi:murein DD-endopeptidase MepM/ murein hydrolase activator NlpD